METSRPESPAQNGEWEQQGVKDVPAVYARLWEDPLESIYRAHAKHNKLSLLKTSFSPIAPDTEQGEKLLVMPILLPGGPYAEEKEERMRTRHAVLAGLGSCGYRLKLNKRMSYVNVPVETYFEVLDKKVCDDEILVPVKLHRGGSIKGGHETEYSGVLILWLNEHRLGNRPLNATLQIINRLFTCDDQERIAVVILGPTGSGGLLNMFMEDSSWNREGLPTGEFPAETRIFSPRATISPDALRPESLPANVWSRATCGTPYFDRLRNCKIGVIRAIGTDRQLAESLRAELILRDAWPEREGSKKHVVLLAEQDTLYGRAIRETFRETVGPKISKDNFHDMTYLRGIDGRIPGDKKPDQGNSNVPFDISVLQCPEGRSQFDYLRRLEEDLARYSEDLGRRGKGEIRAIGVVGSDLYDKYLILRALRKRFPRVWFFTTDLDAGFAHQRELDSTHNLLVASHFGLQLSRKLQHKVGPFRDSYQTATYFATLLALKDTEAAETLASHALVDPWRLKECSQSNNLQGFLQPLVFEIGRNGPYQLTVTQDSWGNSQSSFAKVHPSNPRGDSWLFSRFRWICALVALVCIVSCFALGNMFSRKTILVARDALCNWLVLVRILPPKKPHFSLSDWCGIVLLGGTALVAILMAWDRGSENGEPWPFFEGLNVWPSVLLRYLVVLLSVGFFWKSMHDLKTNHGELRKRYFGAPATKFTDRGHSSIWLSRLLPSNWNKLAACWRAQHISPWAYAGSASSAHALYRFYSRMGGEGYRCLRTATFATVYCGFGLSLYLLAGPPHFPCRGGLSYRVTQSITWSAMFAMIVLMFFVFDATQLCRRFLGALVDHTDHWTEPSKTATRSAHWTSDQPGSGELQAIRLIAERTRVIGQLILYPCLVLLLYILSMHPVLDNWAFSLPLVLPVTLALGGAAFAIFSLRVQARKVKRAFLRRLNNHLLAATAKGPKKEIDLLKDIIDQIHREQRGAFSPLTENPLLVYFAMPFGGVGSLVFFEQLMALVGE